VGVKDIISDNEAGDLIPVKEVREIIKGLPAQSAAFSLCRRANMSTKKERQPVLSALPVAYWVNGATGLKQTTKAEWKNKELVAEELAVIVPVPEVLIEDSDFDIWGEVRPLITEAIGVKLDEACLFGADAPDSFNDAIVPDALKADNALARGDNGDLADDIGGEDGVMGMVEEDGFAVNGFAGRTRLKSSLRGLRDKNGGLLFNPSLQADTPSTLYGEPIYYPDANGSFLDQGVDLVAGDWSKSIVGVRKDMTFKIFEQGVISDDDGKVILNLMQQDAVAMRVVARYGFAVANPINRKNQVEADRYPFAVLESEGS
jgi:HK97 family phage major capsid protein